MTGIAGGGYACWVEAGSDRRGARLLRGRAGARPPAPSPSWRSSPSPSARSSCTTSSVPPPARSGRRRPEALWRRGGTLPWARLVEPALRLAASGVLMPSAHARCLAMLAPVMTMREGGPDLRAGRPPPRGRRPARPAGARGRAPRRCRRRSAHLLRRDAAGGVAPATDGGAGRTRDSRRPRRLPGRMAASGRGVLRRRPGAGAAVSRRS